MRWGRPARSLRTLAARVVAHVPAGGEGGSLPRPAASLLVVMLTALVGLVLTAPDHPSPLPSDAGVAPGAPAPAHPDEDAGGRHGTVLDR